jgi:hypothetical protein
MKNTGFDILLEMPVLLLYFDAMTQVGIIA